MKEFAFHAPDTLQEAADLLGRYGEDAKLLAGGTALMLLLKQSLVQPERLVSLHRVGEARHMERRGDTLHAGALVSQRELETSPLVRREWPLLAEAYRRVATVRIRNAATVGGGLAHGDPSLDPPPALLILGASVRLLSTRGERVVPLSELYVDYYETTIEPDELVTELLVPAQPAGSSWAYLKFLPRTADDYATVAVAALGRMSDGTVEEARVALGSAGPTPVRAYGAEEAIRGESPGPGAIDTAARTVADVVDPLDDVRGSADYKREMAVVFTRRALGRVLAGSEAAGRGQEQGEGT